MDQDLSPASDLGFIPYSLVLDQLPLFQCLCVWLADLLASAHIFQQLQGLIHNGVNLPKSETVDACGRNAGVFESMGGLKGLGKQNSGGQGEKKRQLQHLPSTGL